jgi:hypothetical protein
MEINKSTFFSPEKYIDFRKNEKEYKEIIDKLNPNIYSVLEGLIKTINDDINSNLVFDTNHYIKQFKIDKVFSEEIVYKLRNPQFIKSFENIKGTIESFIFIARLFNIEVSVKFMEDVFLEGQEIKRNYYDYDNCSIDIRSYIDLDEASKNNNKVIDKSLTNIKTIRKVAENMMHVCLFVRSLVVIFLLKDKFNTDKIKDILTKQNIHEYHDEFFKCSHHGDFNHGYDSIFCEEDNKIVEEFFTKQTNVIEEKFINNYDEFNYDDKENYYSKMNEKFEYHIKEILDNENVNDYKENIKYSIKEILDNENVNDYKENIKHYIKEILDNENVNDYKENIKYSIKEILEENVDSYDEEYIISSKYKTDDNMFYHYDDFNYDESAFYHQFGESFTITQR